MRRNTTRVLEEESCSICSCTQAGSSIVYDNDAMCNQLDVWRAFAYALCRTKDEGMQC